MRPLLLDTHALLWWMIDDAQLPTQLRARLAEPTQLVFVSAASVWEIAIKTRKGKLRGTDEYLEHHAELHRGWGFTLVAIDAEDGAVAGSLGFEHSDPFDRVLIAQSQRLGAELATCDTRIQSVHSDTFWE